LEESSRRGGWALSLSVGERTGIAIAAYERHEFTAVEEDEGTLLMRAGDGTAVPSPPMTSYEAHSVDASSQPRPFSRHALASSGPFSERF
jgi:hypothetical protein